MIRFRAFFFTFLLVLASAAFAGHRGNTMRVTVTNLTPGQPLTPALVIVHDADFRLFTIGQAASAGVARIAEEGDTSVAMSENSGNPRILEIAVVGTGPFMPGQSVSVDVPRAWPHAYITVIGMLASTNDAFYALSGHLIDRISTELFVPAYDAGSERNSEDCDFIPGPPCNNMGVRDTAGAEGFITIHNGIHGIADLPARTHDWRNPVARITIEQVRE